MAQEGPKRSISAARELKVLSFWEEHDIFQKSLAKESPKGAFVFYDGPPFATGLPHYGSLLSSIIKDVIPRYKTMRGYHVRRRWGWDCHGLPIENMIEKELGLKSKKEIEEIGIATFNEACRASVLRYADGWKEYIDRIGRWVEYTEAYKTMDVTYMESVWWALKRLFKKGLLYEGRKVLLYCPHCQTPLAKAEVQMDNSYKDVTEEAVTVKFKVKHPEKIGLSGDVYLLAWTTTPWTLPGNVALAVGNDINYVAVRIKNQESRMKELSILARDRISTLGDQYEIVRDDITGSDLVGFLYEPLYDIKKVRGAEGSENAWKVYAADFVTTEEGTGIVHTAVIYGEDDYALGEQENLPMVPLLDSAGHFTGDAPKLLEGLYFKKAEKIIKEDLEDRQLLFKKEMHTHSYPHCHRCDTPLLYNAITSWFINIQKVKKRLIRLNEKVNWVPEHLKHGRFQNILKDAPDWTISRNRYWASPLPIWKCDSCSNMRVVGSIEELQEHTQTSGNRYLVMRHGRAESNEKNIASIDVDSTDHLTDTGVEEVKAVANRIHKEDIDLIIASPFVRTKQTTEILRKELKLKKEQLVLDVRIGEFDIGTFGGKTWDVYKKEFETFAEEYERAPGDGETRRELRARATDFLYEIEQVHKDKKVLIITHEAVIWELKMTAAGVTIRDSARRHAERYKFPTGHVASLLFVPLPHNAYGEIDLHRPYIDAIEFACDCGETMRRIPEVVDGWVESGAMPFAEYHYPFENKRTFKRRSPGDFVSEYIGQTRTWFYYMHAVAGMLFRKPSFQNVVVTGNIQGGDGYKMSKSRGNYTDPLLNLGIYGADALRYYLMASTVMQAEDVRFLDEELREAHNRVVNIFWNVSTFYDVYVGESDVELPAAGAMPTSDHVLDQWILTRYRELVSAVTAALDGYNTVQAGRVIRSFIDDLSTWYLRRSRGRLKSKDRAERVAASSTLRFVLAESAKVVAPIMPFIAESIYQRVKDSSATESVHLAAWPEAGHLSDSDRTLLVEMAEVREVISSALEARARAGIKIRQPLAKLTISNAIDEQYHDLIKDEVNVKEVVVNTQTVERVQLDTEVTDVLKEEGAVRELMRVVQDLRKKEGLKPGDRPTLVVDAHNEESKTFFEKNGEEIKQATLLRDVQYDSVSDGTELSLDEKQFSLTLKQ